MKITPQRQPLPLLILVLWLTFIGLSQFGVSSRAQDKLQVPKRTGLVNDFAGAFDDATRQRLEVMLGNLKQRSGIEFGIATIQTTGTRSIFEVSRDFAVEWNLGARSSKQKSLLLLIAVDEKAAFTQFSRSVQNDLPEGVLGELTQAMRGPLTLGHFSQGVSDGMTHFIDSLAKKVGFQSAEIDQAQVASTTTSEPTATPTPIVETNETPQVVPASTSETLAATRPRKVKSASEAAPSPVETTMTPATTSTTSRAKSKKTQKVNTPEDDADEAEEVELVLTLPLADRVAKLKEFMSAFPNSKSRPRAVELLISTYAALGDLNFKNGDRASGLKELSLAINEAPTDIGEKLFGNVVAQIPSNLYLRDEREAAFDAARQIEAKFGSDAKRLLMLSGFYLGIEEGEEAARLAAQAVKLAPEMAEAHRALGLGLHMALRLDEAAAEYKRALELDPNTKQPTLRSLADLNRASGKTEEALALYRERLTVEPNDRAARAGVILSLLELGRAEEGLKELEAALTAEPQDLVLLTGAAYWFAAHDDSERALDLAQRAVRREPRYTWSQIALARALVGQKRPLEAERAMRFAAQYGKFPTLDYELATVLASLGLYDEAADVLRRSFTYDGGKVSTRLARRTLTSADTFTELLAPERRASIFQFTSADRPGDAAMLKALLALIQATETDDKGNVDEARAVAAAKEFVSGTDNMLAYRQIYAANRLLRHNVALPMVLELTEAARANIDSALEVPAATVAIQAEELRDVRARAIAQGATPDVPDAPRNVLANIMRGRLEDMAGQTLFKEDKSALSLEHFRRAVAILPEGTPAWRDALWHLGTALDQEQQREEALAYYIRSYNAGDPDPIRRVVIEELYRKINGSLAGLDEKISAGVTSNPTPAATTEVAVAAATPEPTPLETTPVTTPVSAPINSPTPAEIPAETPTATPAASPVESSPSATPEASPVPAEPTPSPKPEPSRNQENFPSPVGEMLPTIPSTVKLTGKVNNGAGEPLANVVVVLISPRGTVLSSTTDVDGTFSFVVPPSSQGYRLIPSKEGFTFTPVDKTLSGVIEDRRGVDFVAEPTKPS